MIHPLNYPFVSLLALMLCLTGCVSFTYSSSKPASWDFHKRYEAASASIASRSQKVEHEALKKRAAVSSETTAFVQRHFEKANQLVSTRANKLKLDSGFSLSDYAEWQYARLTFTTELKPSIDIIESERASATAFPTGRVLMTRPLAEGFGTLTDGYNSVLLGVLIHELAHVRFGHAIEQWATADSLLPWIKDQALSGLSTLTTLVPFVSLDVYVDYPFTFDAVRELPELSEFSADLTAVTLLKEAGFESAPYISFLTQMAAANRSTRPTLLAKRADCLERFSRLRYQQPIRKLIIGERVVNFYSEQKVEELLASPSLLAKEMSDYAELTDAQRKDFLVSRMRKWMFTTCAVQHIFPRSKLQGDELSTPSFDYDNLFRHQ